MEDETLDLLMSLNCGYRTMVGEEKVIIENTVKGGENQFCRNHESALT